MTEPETDILAREAAFHDALAAELRAEDLPPRAPDHLEEAVLRGLGDIRGRSILDLGCGSGDLSLILAAEGAHVTGIDVSPGMIQLASERAAAFRPSSSATFMVGTVEDPPVPPHSFDCAVGKWILHHVQLERGLEGVKRALKPGGMGLFIENSGRNPILRFARQYIAGRGGVPRYGTVDERPLSRTDETSILNLFPSARIYPPDFLFFELLDRQVFRLRSRSATKTLGWLDELVWRHGGRLREYSFHILVEVRS